MGAAKGMFREEIQEQLQFIFDGGCWANWYGLLLAGLESSRTHTQDAGSSGKKKEQLFEVKRLISFAY